MSRPAREDSAARRFLRSDLGAVLSLFVASRIVLAIVGMVSREHFRGRVRLLEPTSLPWLDMWAQWDSYWYLRIAQEGYPDRLPAGQSAWGFFPLLPWLTRLLSWFTGSEYLAGLLLTNAAFLVGCLLLLRLVREHFGQEVARGTLAVLFAYPTAFLFSGYLTEPLFFALVVGCFLCACRKRWLAAGLLAAALALTRSSGVFVVVPLLWIQLEQRGFALRRPDRRLLCLALPILGLAVFLAFSHATVGDAFAYWSAQRAGWGPRFPSRSLAAELHRALFLGWDSRLGLVVLAGAVGLLAACWKKLPASWSLYTAYSIALPLAGSLGAGLNLVPSFTRYSLTVFPIFVMLALVTGGSRRVRVGWIAISAALQGVLAFFWAAGAKLVV
jgi:hypothetical protein